MRRKGYGRRIQNKQLIFKTCFKYETDQLTINNQSLFAKSRDTNAKQTIIDEY